jgi:hypothetical protein
MPTPQEATAVRKIWNGLTGRNRESVVVRLSPGLRLALRKPLPIARRTSYCEPDPASDWHSVSEADSAQFRTSFKSSTR